MLKETIHSQQQQKARAREFSEETKFLSCLWLFGLLLKTEHMGKPWNNESILMPKPKKRGSDSFGRGGFPFVLFVSAAVWCVPFFGAVGFSINC